MNVSAARIPDFEPDEALSQAERDILFLCRRAASEGRPMESVEEIMGMFGFNSYSTVPGIMRRLEDKGFITRNVYQRGRQVCIVATGECTAPPPCTVPHWRTRTEAMPTPAIQQVRERMPREATTIEQEARRQGKPMSEFLTDLVYIGWHSFLAEREMEA